MKPPLSPMTEGLLSMLKRKGNLSDADELSQAFDAPGERTPSDDPYVYQLALKKKRNQAVLKQMLSKTGYGDLARMVSVQRHEMGDDLDD